jgi:regulation of enolase protein 1 (concanavalin A-like superfamily)
VREDVFVPSLPPALTWHVPPESWSVDGDGLAITAGKATDLFVDPQGKPAVLNAPRLLGRIGGDFQLSARVTVGFGATFDAGVLLLYSHDRAWAKLCFERSPDERQLVVSVVTRGVSDDANAFPVEADHVWLRVARLAPSFAFHASTDGSRWELVRHFALDEEEEPVVGFLVQSPSGGGCTATFDDIRFLPERLGDLRDGT